MYKSFQEIPQHPQIHYHIHTDWADLEHTINRYIKAHKLQMFPDFQRGHVWTEEQEIAFIEYIMMGGTSGRQIYFNHPGWMSNFKGNFVLVDGLQRLSAVLDFLNNKIKIFGKFFNEYEGRLSHDWGFEFNIATVEKKVDVLKWYYFMNVGGTPHSKEEISKVERMIEENS
jgi:hypothetical protein